MQENTITIGRVLREGWSCFKARPWFWIGVIVLCGVIADIIGLVSSMILEWVGPSAGSPEIGWSVAVVLILLGTFVQIRLQMGLLWMGVITVDGRRARFGDLFAKPHLFWRFLCASILFQLMVMAGFLLLIVPGIYLLARFLPLSFVLMDRETGVLESFRRAQRLTEGHRGKLTAVIFLGYALAFGLFVALSVTAFTVGGSALLVMPIVMLFGVFVFTPIVAPIILLSLASLYRALKNASADQGVPA